MTTDVRDVERAWERRRRGANENPDGMRFTRAILRELAKGQPVTPVRAAELDDDVTEQQVADLFQGAAKQGAEVNGDGALVGSALTLNPTPHRFRVDGNDLYAWCSLDTLFLPALIDAVAEVESTCPVTGETIRLTVGPEGVRSYHPPTARTSVVVPGQTPSCEVDAATGPDSATCTQMNFFATPEAAAEWVNQHAGVEILTIEEANRVARTFAEDPACDCC